MKAPAGGHISLDETTGIMVEVQRLIGRLEKLGWQSMRMAPRDGTHFMALSFGSVGQHETWWMSGQDDPKYSKWSGGWFALDGGDIWPMAPIMWRKKNKPA